MFSWNKPVQQVLQESFQRESHAVYQVNEKLLQTSEGRERYFHFLQVNPNLSCIEKLFGLNQKRANREAIQKQIKFIERSIHPDKFPEAEKSIATRIFQIIQEEKARYKSSASKKERTFFTSFMFSEDSQADRLRRMIDMNQFIHAERELDGYEWINSVESLEEEERILAICIKIKMGKMQQAALFLQNSDEMRASLQEVDDQIQRINHSPNCPETYTLCEQCLNSLERIFSDLSLSCSPYPNALFLRMKECSLSESLEYEQYLRNALRFSSRGEECEGNLTGELRAYIEKYYRKEPEFLSISSKKDFIVYGQEILREQESALQQFAPSDDANQIQTCINRCIENLQDSQNLSELSNALENLLMKLKGKWGCLYLLKGFRKKMIRHFKRQANGLKYFFENKKEISMNFFRELEDSWAVGLILCTSCRYAEALEEFRKDQTDERRHYIFRMMNYSDLLPSGENSNVFLQKLGIVDSDQADILRKKRTYFEPLDEPS